MLEPLLILIALFGFKLEGSPTAQPASPLSLAPSVVSPFPAPRPVHALGVTPTGEIVAPKVSVAPSSRATSALFPAPHPLKTMRIAPSGAPLPEPVGSVAATPAPNLAPR